MSQAMTPTSYALSAIILCDLPTTAQDDMPAAVGAFATLQCNAPLQERESELINDDINKPPTPCDNTAIHYHQPCKLITGLVVLLLVQSLLV